MYNDDFSVDEDRKEDELSIEEGEEDAEKENSDDSEEESY